MRILISPAKKMKTDTDSFLPESLPCFLKETDQLKTALQALSPDQLKRLWKCSDALVELNLARLGSMDLYHHLTPAIFAYEGIQYQYMAPDVLETEQLFYIQQHLRILSGFYGLLRPFDGVVPYRLEMQARLCVNGKTDLYSFWGSRLADALAAETDCILNLASAEYSRAVRPHLPEEVRFITCTFAQLLNGKPVEKGTFCKMARGQMVRWMAEHQVTHPDEVKGFDQMGYAFAPQFSTDDTFVFLKS